MRPVQKMGHCSQGAWREGTHVLRYGFRTTSGRIGGVRVEALARAAAAAWPNRLKRMVEERYPEKMREPCQASKQASKPTWTATNKRREQVSQASPGRTRVVAEGAGGREAGQQVCGQQEAECGDQGKMTEAIRVEKQEDRQERMGWRARSR